MKMKIKNKGGEKMKMYDVYGNEITTEKARELSKTHKKYINELHDFCVFAKNKYELAKYWNVDFGCDVDEFEEEKENVVKFIINEKTKVSICMVKA